MGKRDIGRVLEGSSKSPDLRIGITSADFHTSAKVFDENDLLITGDHLSNYEPRRNVRRNLTLHVRRNLTNLQDSGCDLPPSILYV